MRHQSNRYHVEIQLLMECFSMLWLRMLSQCSVQATAIACASSEAPILQVADQHVKQALCQQEIGTMERESCHAAVETWHM